MGKMTQGFVGTLFMENFAAVRTPLASHHSTVRHLTQKPLGTRRDSDRHAFSRHLEKMPLLSTLNVYPAICRCLYCRHSLQLVDFRKKITGFFALVLPASFRPAKKGQGHCLFIRSCGTQVELLFYNLQNTPAMNFIENPNCKGDKITFYYDFGRGPEQRPSIGVFTYAKPKTPVEKAHNKETLATRTCGIL